MSTLKKVIKWIIKILTIFLVLILLLVIYGKLSQSFSKSKYPNYFGYTLFEVASGSMKPTLDVDDIVLVKITNKGLKVDDIIAFKSEKTVITHRIIYIDKDTITVKGDSNNVVDKPVKTSDVIGKVIKVYPKLGVWKKVIMEPKILIAIFITLLLFDFALSYEPKKESNRKVIKEPINEDPNDNVIVEKIEVKKEKEHTKDITESEKLLDITRKINIEDINKLIEGTEYELTKKEIANVKKEIQNIENRSSEETKLSKKEKEFIDYTIRLDLDEIQERIKKKVK